MIYEEKIINALKLIKSVCEDHKCENCPFLIYENECGITYNEPDDWSINDYNEWRAFK